MPQLSQPQAKFQLLRIFCIQLCPALHQSLQLALQPTMTSERTAVDRAWTSYDIVITILETMAPGPPLYSPLIYPYDGRAWMHQIRQGRKTLARVARVCRALSSIALDILWRYIDDVLHLIGVVPSCYSHESSVEYPYPPYNIVSFCIAIQCLRYSLSMTHPVDIHSGPPRKRAAFSSYLRG